MTAPERASRAEKLLAGAGVRARVREAGQEGEIAAVEVGADALAQVAAQAAAIRALGFRYVALEIGPEGAERAAG